MTAAPPPAGAATTPGLPARRLVALFALTSFLSALLLFWIQPLYSKLVLPLYGGAPAVWTTANMFFQIALLVGYLYAHGLARLPLRHAALLLHFVLLAIVFAWLPILAPVTAPDTESAGTALQLLALLATHVGVPFFAVAATAPLIQQWFAGTRHPAATDPYFLYSASNLGSLAALLGYPFLIEPTLGLARQGAAWTAAFALLVLLLAGCAVLATRYRAVAPAASATPAPAAPAPAPAWKERVQWLALALAPASLLLGVTQHITAEIAAVPLLWVLPLALYILTFVIAFARRPPFKLEAVARVQPWLAVGLALVWTLNIYLSVLLVHLAAFFVTAMMCHAALVRARPAAAHLTEFYLWLALGGALGGSFNALVAPLLFDSYAEYPLALALACLLRPTPAATRLLWRDLAWPAALAAALLVLIVAGVRPLQHGAAGIVLYLEAVGIALYLMHRSPVRFALGVLALLLLTPALHSGDRLLARQRSFFGVHSVLEDETGKFRVLMHGITIHGAQFRDRDRARQATTYYHRDSPIGQIFTVLGPRPQLREVAVVGLGAGTLGCYRKPDQHWTFFEIDPLVVRFARDSGHFTFLEKCAPGVDIVIGDARLSLARARDESLDLLVIDAFSSDAIPVHLLTREAFALYLRKLAPRGVLAMHISNQYLDLAPIVARLAADAGVAAFVPGPRLELQLDERLAAMESKWIAIARAAVDMQALVDQEGWTPARPGPGTPLWTDDFSNIVGALK